MFNFTCRFPDVSLATSHSDAIVPLGWMLRQGQGVFALEETFEGVDLYDDFEPMNYDSWVPGTDAAHACLRGGRSNSGKK